MRANQKSNNIKIYNILRDIHKVGLDRARGYLDENDSEYAWKLNAIDSIEGVLYLAEGVFSKD